MDGEYISIQEAASKKGVSEQSIRDILRDDDRRREILPSAVKVGEGKRGIWLLRIDEVEAWTPRNYPR